MSTKRHDRWEPPAGFDPAQPPSKRPSRWQQVATKRPVWMLAVVGVATLLVGAVIGLANQPAPQAAATKVVPGPTVTQLVPGPTATKVVPGPAVTKSVPGPTVTKTVSVPGPTVTVTPPAAASISGDGTYVVGTEVAPGTYHTAGAADGNCYWERLSGLSGTFDDIIANDNTDGPTTVTISATDKAFKTDGCESWSKIG